MKSKAYYKKHIAIWLKMLRKKAKLTQHDISKSLGMSQQNYGFIERGQTSVNFEDIPRLAEALGTDVETFLMVLRKAK